MAASTKTDRRASLASRRSGKTGETQEMCSLTVSAEGALRLSDLTARERADDVQQCFRTARVWRRDNWFVGSLLGMKASFVRFGQSYRSASREKKSEFNTWLKQETPDGRNTNRMVLDRYVQTSVDEFMLCDSLISFWREDESPYPLECERCRYTDAMGHEVLQVKLGYTSQELKAAGFSQQMINRYSEGWVLLDENKGENFRVLTRGMVGNGLGAPRLAQVFRTCSQNESMEVGESLYAYLGRMVERTHSLGWEVRTKDVGMRQQEAMWNAKRAKEIERQWKGMVGGVGETTRNFDHKTQIQWIDSKNFDAKKWETIIARLQWWGGPLAMMLIARNLNPNFMPAFKAEIADLRGALKPHLEHVINKSLNPPGGISLEWTDECFADMRLMWDMVKTLVQQGAASLNSAQRFAGLDPDREADLKITEADDPQKDKKFMPLFDMHHGNRPGKQNNGGRTPGVEDKGGKQ